MKKKVLILIGIIIFLELTYKVSLVKNLQEIINRQNENIR